MDFSKLKLDKFQTYNGFYIPKDITIPLTIDEHPEVYFLFCERFEEVIRYTNIILNNQSHKENRIFYIYKKGNKTFHRDHINAFIEKAPYLKRKAPMLSSLSSEYSCVACMLNVGDDYDKPGNNNCLYKLFTE